MKLIEMINNKDLLYSDLLEWLIDYKAVESDVEVILYKIKGMELDDKIDYILSYFHRNNAYNVCSNTTTTPIEYIDFNYGSLTCTISFYDNIDGNLLQCFDGYIRRNGEELEGCFTDIDIKEVKRLLKDYIINDNYKKVSLNELLNIASYNIVETTVPPFEQLKKEFSDTWADLYFDDDLKNKEGEKCYIIYDNVMNNIRAVVVSDKFDYKTKVQLIDIMDNVIFDLIYHDIIEQLPKFNSNNESYDDLFNYINSFEIMPISNYEYTWLKILVEGRLDLLIL